MTQRDRQVLVYLFGGLGVVFAIGFLGFQFFWKPFQENKRTISRLEKENEEKLDQILSINKGKKLLEKARRQSLPSNMSLARTEYREFLETELKGCNLSEIEIREITQASSPGTAASKKEAPAHTVLAFQVGTQGSLENVVAFFERIKSTPLMHRIKSFTIDRPEQQTGQKGTAKLKVGMVVEALVVNRADHHTDDLLGPEHRLAIFDSLLALRGGPVGVGMITWVVGPTGPVARHQLRTELKDRTYADLSYRNIFTGDVPKQAPPKEIIAAEDDDGIDVLSYVKLAMIYHKEMENGKIKYYAELRNWFNDPNSQLAYVKLSFDLGYRIFTIKNESLSKTVVRGHVLRIDQHDVYFQVGDSAYKIGSGQTMAEAMRRPLREGDLEELKIELLEPDPDDATAVETPKKGKKQKR